jgi:phage gpG-like protein
VYVSTRVEGLNQLVRGLVAAGTEVQDLKEAFSAIAKRGADLASGFAPRRSGRLESNVRGNRAKNKAVILAGGARVKYAPIINFGWPARGIPANWFMQRADRELAPEAPQLIEDELTRILQREGL